MLGWHLSQGSGGMFIQATSAWGQASRRAEKTCLAEVSRPLPLVLGGQDVLFSP